MLRLPWPGLFKTIRTTKNWYSVLLLAFMLGRDCIARFRDGNTFVIERGQRPNYSIIRAMLYDNMRGNGPKVRILIDTEYGQVLDLGGYKFVIAPQFSFLPLYLIFFQHWLPDEDLSGFDVIDIGAYTGDTAIYFASKGARVYAYEPVPEAFSMMRRNIALNGLKTTVLIYNSALNEDSTSTILVDTDTYEGSTSLVEMQDSLPKSTEIHIDSITLKNALARCDPASRKLLKLNCEGCEFGVITSPNGELLRKFDEILCFYHSLLAGIPKAQLTTVLEENGFEVMANDKRSLIIAHRLEAQVNAGGPKSV